MNKVLEVKSLKLGFKTKKNTINVLEDIKFSVNKGQILGIVGESGCGKSLTASAIMRLLPKNAQITSGEIVFEDKNILEMSMKELIDVRGKDIAMIFQEPMTSLNPVHSIEKQLSEILTLHTKMSKEEKYQRSVEMLKAMNIPSPEKVIKQFPHELSGGMRQRVMIAMAMSCNPKVLIADEPTTALDVTIQAQILEIMKNLTVKFDSSIVLITHNLGVVNQTCDYVVVMYAGQIVEKAPVRELFDNPAHPYTKGLISCVVDIDSRRNVLTVIEGTVPLPENFPKGCRFAPRCKFASQACEEKQEFKQIGKNHFIKCCNYHKY